jgi:WD40 repeat protein
LAALQKEGTNLWVWELGSGRLITTLASEGSLGGLAWNPEGTLLVVGRQDGEIDIWNVKKHRLQSRLQGHGRLVTQLAFSHRGDLLASASWDHTIRLWDVGNAQQLVVYRTRDTKVHFSPDDRTLAYAVSGDNASLLEVASGTAYRRLAAAPELTTGKLGGFSPDGRLAVGAGIAGIGIWDVADNRQVGVVTTNESSASLFLANGAPSLVTSAPTGLYKWPLNFVTNNDEVGLRVGPPECLFSKESLGSLSVDRNGTRIVAGSKLAPIVFETARPTNLLRLDGQLGSGSVAIEPSGRWIAAGSWKGSGVRVYDTASGGLLKQLPVKRTAAVAFSPDGSYLATADMMELKFWSTANWEPLPGALPGDRVSELNPLAFSPDGRMLATVRGSYYEIKLLRVPTCEVLATLRAPSLAAYTSLSFSPNGTQLAAEEWGGPLGIWDLGLIRQELKKLNLDWDLPPLSSSSGADSAALTKLSLEVEPPR